MTSNINTKDKLTDLFFNQPKVLYKHLFDSYDQFVSEIIPYSLIQEQNYFYENVDKELIYLHGFKCSNIRIKPATFENDNEIKFPSDCRKNHLNYFAPIVADVQQFVEKVDTITGDKTVKLIGELEKETPVANIPIMVKSKFCSTNIKQDIHGECKFDSGGYFLVGGQEKVVLSMEKMADNKTMIFGKKDPTFDNGMVYTAQINSRRNDWSDNLQILTVKNRKDGVFTISTSSQLVDIPLFILLRALGIEADQNIISHITYDLEDVKMINLIRPSVAASCDEMMVPIRTKEEAIEYLITKIRRNKRISQSDETLAKIQKKMYLDKILRQDLLPHLGEDIPKKIAFIGMMTNQLINVMLGRADADDRDALHNKRIEPPGILLGQLFRQNWKKMLNEIGKLFKKKNQSDDTPINIISQIKPSTIEQGLKTALATGIWGMNKTKKGVAQSLQRLSWVQAISSLRRILAPSMDETTAKVTSIRFVNNNQLNLLCPSETPEGAKIGIVKSLSMMSGISVQNSTQSDVLKGLLKMNKNIKHPYDIDPLTMNRMVKIFINGDWNGVCKISEATSVYDTLKKSRRDGIIDKMTSILFDYRSKEIRVYYDGGRLIRPVLIVNNNKLNFTPESIKDIEDEYNLNDKTKSWKNILSKHSNLVEYEDIESFNYAMVAMNEEKLQESIDALKRVVEYKESTKINRYGDYRFIKYTHCDFSSWIMLGAIVGNIPFCDHNYATRNIIHFSQAKQAIGIYMSSYKDRMDISQVLYQPQLPLVTTQAMKYNNCMDLPYGENAIVAICSYTGLTDTNIRIAQVVM
jgi:DNA-directed RNA polymerase II subunit RPB2